ncbi:biopolymer transporter ExbD [Anoxybacter fermentans]|uniref:Biopolymer transporter ExbD n=1 Tax=Anoxybacter fermentans TaxID=1323375 RepID=A0A3S9SWL1_9FIRM|nr:biopolymer transporter ExbD [Anoxybacter fermentans]AZR72622.1 biopolymer transporter ExbD [Anoxybacter fermentans]
MFKSKLKKRPRIEIVPMIDVIFFLLVFFMLFTTFKTTPYGFDLKLPKATAVVKTESVNILIQIANDGQLFLKDKPVTLSELKEQVRQKLEDKPDTVIVIKADENAKYKSLIQVMDAISQVGGTKFSLAAEKDERKK